MHECTQKNKSLSCYRLASVSSIEHFSAKHALPDFDTWRFWPSVLYLYGTLANPWLALTETLGSAEPLLKTPA